ncbi:MAG: protease inhibitor I42 family protein [SAR202 cluster bacterium]|nr:protease inhibitor I42 family protein [SAR202 cluster bacterium]
MVGCTEDKAAPTPAGVQSLPAALSIPCEGFQVQAHRSEQLQAVQGRTFTIEVCSNPTTGFEWEAPAISNTGVVSFVEERYLAPGAGEPGTPEVVGAAGREQLTFRAGSPGTTTISLAYSRPWEGGEKGEWTLAVEVTTTSP